MNTAPSRLLVFVLLAAAAAASWTSRPLMPPNETRDLSIAWEMWSTGDVLVPQLNGQPVDGAAPLASWMTQAGWLVTGPTPLWPRLLGLFTAALAVFALARAARLLWGEQDDPAWRVRAASMVFVGMVFVQMLATTVGGSLWLAVATLLAWSHLARARDEKRWPWAGLGLATGIGLLAAGPIALLFTLPPFALGRFWAGPLLPKGWWTGGLRAYGLGIGLYMAWAIPAAWNAGDGFAAALFAGPAYDGLDLTLDGGGAAWTAAALLMLLFPWVLWSPLWHGWLKSVLRDGPTRMIFLGTVPGLGVLALLRGGLHPQDLVPALPALALCAGRILETREKAFTQSSLYLPSFATMGLGVLALFLPARAATWGLPEWVANANGTAAGATLIIGGLLLLFLQAAGRNKPSVIAAMGPLVLIAVHIGVAGPAKAWDLTPVSRQLSQLQREGVPLAFVSERDYQGQFHFLGRLQKPLDAPQGHAETLHWLGENPQGAVIVEVPPGLHNSHLVGTGTTMVFTNREGRFALWKADQLQVVLKRAGRPPSTEPPPDFARPGAAPAKPKAEAEAKPDKAAGESAPAEAEPAKKPAEGAAQGGTSGQAGPDEED